jgi:hypothetical protein
MAETGKAFDFGKLGEDRWREMAQAAGASEKQMLFAVARHGGATASTAARLAGYAGDGNAIRSAGYSALRSGGVQSLLELAAIECPDEAAISDREVDAKIAKLVRSADPQIALRAIDAHGKRQERSGADEENGPCSMNETALRMLKSDPIIAPTVLISVWFGHPDGFTREYAATLLAPICRRDFPDLWARTVVKYPDLEGLGAAPALSIDQIVAALAREVAKEGTHIAKRKALADAAQQPAA